ncbi:MAG: type IX secretion system membrane protein PorP/SprF [Pedobacter sp.]|nr:MAG: type IX secretion system membrane protein PorP/SprF [Pedobacter sp.]
MASTAILMGISAIASAQLTPLGAQYFNNQYLGNPALAGIEEGFVFSADYRQQWSTMPGSPKLQNLTANYGFRKVGVGLNILNDRAGLQRQTRVVGTYAYHLPVSEENTLHFGISLGILSQHLDQGDLYGDPNDVVVGAYNARESFVDGDFGAAFTSKGLNIQAALPNLKSFFKKDDVRVADVGVFYTAVSYRISINDGSDAVGLEPKVAFRGVKGYKNILDAGAEFTLANRQIMLMGMYHSTESATFGMGMNLKNRYLISGMYTTETSQLTSYANGTFELNLRLFIGKRD